MHVLVTARKWSEPDQNVPGAMTVQDGESLRQSGSMNLRDAAETVPNLTLGHFSVRSLTFPYVRGVGSGRNSPAVTTCIDGVPQLSYATANQEFLAVERVEFLRGAQGAIYGQNALGGTVNIVPRLPAPDPSGSVTLTVGDHATREARFDLQGPLGDEAAVGLAAGYAARDGYTLNRSSDNNLDGREALFGFGQLYWPDLGPWSIRLSLGWECDRDGDYTLKDLGSVRRRSDQIFHDYEGFSNRDIVQPVLTLERRGDRAEFALISALQAWETENLTDLDMLPLSLMRRGNQESQVSWIEELRLASPRDAPIALSDRFAWRWLVGMFAYSSAYSQSAYNDYRPLGALLFGFPVPYRKYDDTELDNLGASLFGQSALILDDRFELAVGLRGNLEQRAAVGKGYTLPRIEATTRLDETRTFRQLSPQVSLSWRLADEILTYVQATRGFKAGGFNAQAPAGSEDYDEETSWTCEAGVKSSWLAGRFEANVSVFRTTWDQIQLDVPAGLPNMYYIDNAGKAVSRGAELEFKARPFKPLALFGGVGLLDARFSPGSQSGGTDIGGNDLPFAPHFNWHAGAEFTRSFSDGARGFLRTEAIGTGRYAYDAIAGESQDQYTLVNMRAGVAFQDWRIEFWVRNLCDSDYVPLAFPYPLSLSGYVGEPGAPRTAGASITRRF